MLTPAQYQALKPLMTYRRLLKGLRKYPSKNRYELLLAMQDEFRENQKLTDPIKMENERKKAIVGAQHVDYYVQKSQEFEQGGRVTPDEVRHSVFSDKKDFVYF